jgi:predicted dehydrogenase
MPGYDVEDASAVAVQFASGAVGSLVSCCASRAGGGVHLLVTATRHHITLSGWEHTAVIRKSAIEEEHIAGEPNIFELEDAAFIQAVNTGERSLVRAPYADAIKTLAFCLAANQSLQSGAPVQVASL